MTTPTRLPSLVAVGLAAALALAACSADEGFYPELGADDLTLCLDDSRLDEVPTREQLAGLYAITSRRVCGFAGCDETVDFVLATSSLELRADGQAAGAFLPEESMAWSIVAPSGPGVRPGLRFVGAETTLEVSLLEHGPCVLSVLEGQTTTQLGRLVTR